MLLLLSLFFEPTTSTFINFLRIPPTERCPFACTFPTQHGTHAKSFCFSTHVCKTTSVALPHTCNANATSKSSSNVSIKDNFDRTFVNFALSMRSSSIRMDVSFKSTPIKSCSGNRKARAKRRFPVPHPKSTIVFFLLLVLPLLLPQLCSLLLLLLLLLLPLLLLPSLPPNTFRERNAS